MHRNINLYIPTFSSHSFPHRSQTLASLSLTPHSLSFFEALGSQQWPRKAMVLRSESISALPTPASVCGNTIALRSSPTTKGTGRRRLMWLSLTLSVWSVMRLRTRSPWTPSTPSSVIFYYHFVLFFWNILWLLVFVLDLSFVSYGRLFFGCCVSFDVLRFDL